MTDQIVMAKRINNGQSEIWIEGKTFGRLVIATNNIVYAVRTLCSADESASFHTALGNGEALVPQPVAYKLISDFGL